MIVRAIDGSNDWTFGKGINDYLTKNNAIAQNIQTRLQSFLGDCFFDQSAGLDWYTLLGSKNQLALKLAVNAVILNTDGVTGIITVDITLNSSTRVATINYSVDTIYTVLTSTALIGA